MMGEADLLKGWASQGKKKGQSTSEAGEKRAGERAVFKHLKVKIKGQEMRISALFDKDVPNTLIGYGVVMSTIPNGSTNVPISKLIIGTKPKRFDVFQKRK
jgi:hypothetical protein